MADPERQVILFVADHAEQYGVRLMLESSGYKIVHRDTLVSALQFLMAQEADMALVDCALQSNRGLELCRTICNDPTYQGTPVVMVGRDDKQATNCLQSFSYGAEDFVQAPFIPAVLLARVGRLLKKNLQGAISGSLSVQVNAAELPGILQYLETEMKTGTLNIESGERTATIYFLEGSLVNARTPDMEGFDVITEVLCWPTSQVTFVEEDIDPKENKLQAQITGVVMNCAVEVDEYHEIRRNLPDNDVTFRQGVPLPDDAPDPQRQILYAALHGYSVEDIIHGIHPSERKATMWLNELLENDNLRVGPKAFGDYTDYCRQYYGGKYVSNKLTAIRTILSEIEFPLRPPGHASLASCDWLSPVPRLMLSADNREHLKVFVKTVSDLYKCSTKKQSPERRVAKGVSLQRFDFGNKVAFEMMTLPEVTDHEFAMNLDEYLQDAFAVVHFASAQDQETNRHVQRVERILRQRFRGVYYHVVPRVFNDDGKCLFKINCLHCGFKLAVDMDEAGFSGDCPVCGRSISIPDSMDNLSNALSLPEDVPVVRIEPAQPLHCRDLLLMVIDTVLQLCSPQAAETTAGGSAVQEQQPKAKRTKISVAETQAFRVDGELGNPGETQSGGFQVVPERLPREVVEQPPPVDDENVDPNAFAPIPQDVDPEDAPKYNEVMNLLSQEKPEDEIDLASLLQDDDEDIDDFISKVQGPE